MTPTTQIIDSKPPSANILVPAVAKDIAELYFAGVDRRKIQQKYTGINQSLIDAAIRQHYAAERNRRPDPPASVLSFPRKPQQAQEFYRRAA